MAVRGIDAVLTRLPGGVYDIQIDDSGDVETADAFDTAIIVSLLSDKRASESEMLEPQRRRGWIGNESTPGFEIGSKLWLFEQSRLTRTVMNQIVDEAKQALQWMVDAGLAVEIRSVEVNLLPPSSPIIGIQLTVEILRSPSVVEQRYFNFWAQTGLPKDVLPSEETIPPDSAPFPLNVTQSVDLDGVNESFDDTAFSVIGFADPDVFTVSVWAKPTASSTGSADTVLDLPQFGTNFNRFTLDLLNTPDEWQINLATDSSTGYKQFVMPATVDEWVHHVFVVDMNDTGTELAWYIDGVDITASATKNFDIMTGDIIVDNGRQIRFGRSFNTSREFEGRIYSVAMWDGTLTAEQVAAVYNGGDADVDLRVNFGAYEKAADLVRYYVPGLDDTSGATMGTDYGVGTSRDLTPTNITPADLVSDVPE